MKSSVPNDPPLGRDGVNFVDGSGPITLACPACQASEARPLFLAGDLFMGLPGQYRYVRCQGCGLVRLDPRPPRIAAYYPPQYYASLSVKPKSLFRTWRLRRRAAWARQAVQSAGGRVLEIGCGSGEFLDELRRSGLDVEGLDFSASAVALARQHGLEVRQGAVEDVRYPAGRFDLVVLRHLLEHVAEPADALRRVAASLRPRGHILIEVPNRKSIQAAIFGKYWFGYDPPRHLFAFSPDTLARLLGAAGFELVWTKHLFSPAVWGDSLRNFGSVVRSRQMGWGNRPLSPAYNALRMVASYLPALAEVGVSRAGTIAVLAVKR